jgi:hypothetical protein
MQSMVSAGAEMYERGGENINNISENSENIEKLKSGVMAAYQ